MSGIGIIANPHSKLNKRNPRRKELLGYILGTKGQLELTKSLDELATAARTFREQNVSVLAINGGDGTISRTLTAFIRAYEGAPMPLVALLRGGTMNVIATNLEIKGTPEQVLYRLIETHSSGEPFRTQKLTTLNIDGNYGFLFGTGTVVRFLEEFYLNKKGPLSAGLLLARICGARYTGGGLYERIVVDERVSLEVNGQPPVTHDTLGLLCASVERMPMGPRLFPLARRYPGQFQTVSFNVPRRDLVWQLPLIMLKSGLGSDSKKLSFCSADLAISRGSTTTPYALPETIGSAGASLATATRPIGYTLDGELFSSEGAALKIMAGPEIEFIVV